jgi:hypothetical protein
VVIAVVAVRVVQVAIDEVVDVVAVGDGLMPTAWAMDVLGGVACAAVRGGALRWVLVAHGQAVLFDRACRGGVVEVAVVEVVHVPVVLDGGVAAGGAVLVVVVGVGVA